MTAGHGQRDHPLVAVPGAGDGDARFGLVRASADLTRLVLRSRAPGLRTRLAAALILVLAGKWVGVYAPLLIQHAIDALSRHRNASQTVFLAFAGYAIGWTGLRFLASAAPLARDAVFTPVSQDAMARSATETFGHVLGLSLNFHQSKQSGGLARIIDRGARSTDFLIRSVLFSLGPTLIELVMASAVLTAHFGWRLAAVTIATIIVYVGVTFSISDWRIGHRRRLNAADSEAAGLAVDALMNYETIKAFGSDARVVGRYGAAMQDYAHASVRANTSLQLLNGAQSVVLNLGLVGVVLIAGGEAAAGRMSVGAITACILILQQVYAPLNVLGMNYREIRQAIIDMEQMIALRNTPAEIVDAPDAEPLPAVHAGGAELTFEGVSYRHDARSAGLSDVSFTARAGETVALVGPSGGGKTTIARLALRLLDPQAGSVRIDGRDLRGVRLASLRRAAALVPQDVALFNDTLRVNLAFGRPDADEAEIWAAAASAELADFIRTLPQGLETRVGERGLKLSGGERQRVGLARALLAHPRLLVLDEATSALDGPTEAAIQSTLRKVREGRTTLVIAHRLSTIADADQILVVRRGRVVERGDHASLIARGGEYAALWRRQTRAA